MQELCSHTYIWNRKELEVEALSLLTHQQLVEFFAQHISVRSPTRRRICCHVTGRAALDVLKESGVGKYYILLCVCARTTLYVSSSCYMCALILHAATSPAALRSMSSRSLA